MRLPASRKSLTAAVVLSLAAALTAACSQEPTAATSNPSDRPSATAAAQEAHGLSADPSENTSEELRAAATAEDWAASVQIIDCDTPGCDGARKGGVYTPLPKSEITKPWSICAVVPHVKDPYWVGQDANLVAEAKRTGTKLQVFEAGGYTEISKQLNQLSNCVAGGADAVIVSAVSNEALNPKIEEIANSGTVVIDAVNGVTSKRVNGRALFDYCTLGGNLGKHLKETGEKVKAVWFPGPAGVGSLENLMSCFKKESAGGNVELLGVKYGDTGKDAQLALIENALQSYPDMNYIVGSATTAEAAVGPLTERKLQDKIKTAAYYFTPEVYNMLEGGQATCASAGNDLILGRIAVDMAIRALEKKPFVGGDYIGTNAQVVCGPAAGAEQNNLNGLVKELNLAPDGFRPIFNVG
jgi:protein TorT